MYYPLAIREGAPSNFEVRDALEEVETVGPGVALAITSSKEPAKESEPFGRPRRMKVRTLMHPKRL